jgi:hypothetical protein
MPLHLLKLCVGCDSPAELEEWIDRRLRDARKRGLPAEHAHITRMMPKRADELMAGGSLYWVIRGEILCRQQLTRVEGFRDKEGISRCRLVLKPKLVLVEPRSFRPFQGWRYLAVADAPRDINNARPGMANLPELMRRELRELGLL